MRAVIGWNDAYTVRQACIAMEEMDLSPLVPQISTPLLMSNARVGASKSSFGWTLHLDLDVIDHSPVGVEGDETDDA